MKEPLLLAVVVIILTMNSGQTKAADFESDRLVDSNGFEVTGESRHFFYPDFETMDVQALGAMRAVAQQHCGNAFEIGPRTTEWLADSHYYFTRMKSTFECP